MGNSRSWRSGVVKEIDDLVEGAYKLGSLSSTLRSEHAKSLVTGANFHWGMLGLDATTGRLLPNPTTVCHSF